MSVISNKKGIKYLEYCRINAQDGKLSYMKASSGKEKFYSIPHANVAALLLGPGTSITQRAAVMLAVEGVMVGFTSSGATPLYLASQSEYRPTEYLHQHIKRWIDPEKRLKMAKVLQHERAAVTHDKWLDIFKSEMCIKQLCDEFLKGVDKSNKESEILGYEGIFTKKLYQMLARYQKIKMKRLPKGRDSVNTFLTNGNYIAYGYASVTLWGLGIPASFPVLHGKTRRGGLVFDLADVYKSAYVLPLAFECAKNELTKSEFRNIIVSNFEDDKVLKKMFNTIKEMIEI
jgi:CRISPR-associated protein Cas1